MAKRNQPKRNQPKKRRPKRAPAKGIDELTMMLGVVAEFRQAVIVLEQALAARGLDCFDVSRNPNGGLSQHHSWAAAKAVAHFNLHQAIESIFKLMLALERTKIPPRHNLSELFGNLSPQTKRDFNAIYENAVKTRGEWFDVFVYRRGKAPPDPRSLPEIKVPQSVTLRGFLDFLDNVLNTSTRRYQAESVGRREPLYYFRDIGPYVQMLECMDLYARQRWRDLDNVDDAAKLTP